jgi:hypothetical protein
MQAIHSRSKRERPDTLIAPPAMPPAPAPAISPSVASDTVEAGSPVISPPTAAPAVPSVKRLRSTLPAGDTSPL